MTEISIMASGSRGDVQPFVALGKGLKAAGYSVRILTSDSFESMVTDAGLRFCSTGESIEEILQTDEWRKVTESGNFIAILGKMRSEMKARSAGMAERLPELLKGTDLLMGLFGSFTMAEMLKVPFIQTYVFPFSPTSAFPSPLVPNLPIGGAVNRWSFHAMRQMMWQSTRIGDEITRKKLGMGKSPFWGPYKALEQAKTPVLYGYSSHVLPRPADWGSHQQVTGFWFLDPPDNWTPPPDLVAFLEAGAPPVYIGFGSMGSRHPEEAARIAVDALKLSGQRGVLASGWGGLKVTDVPETVHLISSVPHNWLFPQMAAVVHHGGIGTTAAGLRAGVPTVIVPFMGDQPFWGKRVHDLGVGTRPIPRRQLTAERLAGAITQAVSSAQVRQQASELGTLIRAEDGVAKAVAVVEDTLNHYKG